MWQTLERKAAFINQVATGRAADREVDDIGDQALSYAEVKALATGNPAIVEKASVDSELSRLGRLRRAHLDDQHRLRAALDAADRRASVATGRIDRLETVISRRTDTRGERFATIIESTGHTKRADAGEHLHRLASHLLGSVRPGDEGSRAVGQLAGLDLHAGVDRRIDDEIWIGLPEAAIELRYSAQEWAGVDPSGLVQRLERRVQGLDAALDDARGDQASAQAEAARARARIGAPFEHEASLGQLRRRAQEINEALLSAPEAGPLEPDGPVEASAAQRMAARLAAAEKPAAARTPPPPSR